MDTPSKDIKDILVNDSVGTFGTNLFISKEPSSPDACVTIYDTGGPEPQAGYVYDYPTIQVRIRGAKMGYEAAFTKAQAVRTSLHGLHNETWNSTRYIGIWCQGDIMALGYDENHRPLLVVNFRIHRTT